MEGLGSEMEGLHGARDWGVSGGGSEVGGLRWCLEIGVCTRWESWHQENDSTLLACDADQCKVFIALKITTAPISLSGLDPYL